MRALLAIMLAIGLVTCSLTNDLKPDGSELGIEQLAGAILGEWQVSAVAGSPIIEGSGASISFGDGRVAGNTGCNRFFGGFELIGTAFSLGNLGSTRRLCDAALMAQEVTFLASLGSVRTVTIDGGSLVLIDESGDELMRAMRN